MVKPWPTCPAWWTACRRRPLPKRRFSLCSAASLSPQQAITVGPGYQLPFARDIRQQVAIPVIGVGLITDPQQAEAALEDGDADLIALARAVLYDPHWPWHAAASLGAQVRVPSQYLRSEPHGLKGTLLPNR